MVIAMTAKRSNELDDLAKLIFQRTGLNRCVELIYDEVEDELYGSYESIELDTDDDGIGERRIYGSDIHESVVAVAQGKFSSILSSILAENEKSLLLQLLDDGNLEIAVVRTDDTRQTWHFDLQVPFVLNKPDAGYFVVSFVVNVPSSPNQFEINAHTSSEVTEGQISNTLMLYSLQS